MLRNHAHFGLTCGLASFQDRVKIFEEPQQQQERTPPQGVVALRCGVANAASESTRIPPDNSARTLRKSDAVATIYMVEGRWWLRPDEAKGSLECTCYGILATLDISKCPTVHKL